MVRPSPASHRPRASAIALLALAAAGLAAAQPAGTPDSLRQRYERQLAACNSGQLSGPARDACVRDTGRLLDRATSGVTGEATATTPDGRATVVLPQALPAPEGDSGLATSPDGRSTVIVPAAQ
jgi:hypothetical protein